MTILRKLSYTARKQEVTWRYLFNLAPTLGWQNDRSQLTAEAHRVLSNLNRDGIAVTTAEDLLGPKSVYPEMEAAVAVLEEQLATELRDKRRKAGDTSALGQKTFLYHLLGKKPLLDEKSVFARFALQNGILDVVNSYFGMFTRLREYNVWHTFASDAPARESQLWHRDREDRLILKVFVYLNDIDEGAGPFTYAPGTHQKGPIQTTPESYDENGVRRTTDEQMARVVPADRWIRATGRKSSIIFTDTHGYHKGGHAITRDRIMYTSMFTSPASESGELMERPTRPAVFTDLARTVAMAPPRRRFWFSLPPAAR